MSPKKITHNTTLYKLITPTQANSTKHTKVGIIIPIYNVQPYLRQCLDSVLYQSYRDFQALLVNDGSSDESLAIALEYVTKDSRFILIDKENGGVSSARNVGIDFFKGAYNGVISSGGG